MIVVVKNNSQIVNLNKMRKNNKTCIVLYYASWCPACKFMLPDWKKFEMKAKEYNKAVGKSKEVNVFRIESEFIPDDHNINAYPTILKYKSNKPIYYDKLTRSVDDFVDFAEIKAIKSKTKSKSKPKAKSKSNLNLNQNQNH